MSDLTNERADVIVLGAGIVGVSAAYAARQRGMSVILVDRKEPGSETSYGNAGILSSGSISPLNNPSLWKSTAIFITFDETGGYYDSGYIQPVSFFGDGPRVPMMVVSPYARQGFVDHTYTDHVSILKFIEANWGLSPLTSYSEDNLPNATPGVYVPHDRPAIGNLMTAFDFFSPHFGTVRLGVRSEPAAGVMPSIGLQR